MWTGAGNAPGLLCPLFSWVFNFSVDPGCLGLGGEGWGVLTDWMNRGKGVMSGYQTVQPFPDATGRPLGVSGGCGHNTVTKTEKPKSGL